MISVKGLPDKLEKLELSKLKWIILSVVFIFVWTMMTHRKYSGSGDVPHYMMIAHSLVFDRDLSVTNNYEDRTNLISNGNLPLSEAHAARGRDGKLYPIHNIGMPLLFSPYFALAYWVNWT